MSKGLQLHYGQAVDGNMRFDRPELHRRLTALIDAGSGVRMFGLRRIGKSTLRQVVREHFAEAGRPCAYVDAQGSATLAQFLTSLASALPDRGMMTSALGFIGGGPAHSIMKTILDGEALDEAQVSAYWQLIARAMSRAATKDGQSLAIIVDEFSYLIYNLTKDNSEDGRRDADNLLSALRQWRDQGVKMLLTGSLGLAGIARRRSLNLEHLNDLQNFEVPELTEEEAKAFIALAVSDEWTDAHVERFVAELGSFFPSFVVKGLIEIGVDKPRPVSEIAEVFEKRIRPELHGIFLGQFDRRFRSYLNLPNGEREGLVTPILKGVLASGESLDQSSFSPPDPFTRVDLSQVLEILQDDGFLVASETRDGNRLWRPANRLVRLWWQRAGLA